MKNRKPYEFFAEEGGVNPMRRQLNFIPADIVNIKALIAGILLISVSLMTLGQGVKGKKGEVIIRKENLGGYMIVKTDKVDQSYNAGYSIYTAAWPLLRHYPGRSFQSGLFGTWMFPLRDQSAAKEKLYSDIEGGLGWWRSTQYATITPKFNMGGVQLNFVGWSNGPGNGNGRDWRKPNGKYGVAQLSPWLLFPPDGLDLKQGTCGQLFGYGYLPLPLTEPKSATAGKNVPTGNQSWTLFLNTGNFKGPVAFFTPYFWSQVAVDNPKVSGLFLDCLPSNANKAYEMETQYIPSAVATDSKGEKYARIAPTQYPLGPDGTSEIMNRLMVYNRRALWDRVKDWFEGGSPFDGTIDTSQAVMQQFSGQVRSTWSIYSDHTPRDKRALLNMNTFFSTNPTDSATFRLSWNSNLLTGKKTQYGKVLTLPQYYHFVKKDNDTTGEWVAVAPQEVPVETGLQRLSFRNPDKRNPMVYLTPDDPRSCWKNPGPVAGPFRRKLGDGSTVTYYWYRFADQPALLNADLTSAEREEMQKRVEKLQHLWTKDRQYLPPPTAGKLADIDPALIVTPPKGLEVGYVPIVTRQEMEK